jgi:tRNA-dihydrouridine synthase B
MDLNRFFENPFVLAPLAGIADSAFRRVVKKLGCGMVFTELVSAKGLIYNSEKTEKLLEYADIERPIIGQIFGDSPKDMAIGAKRIQELGFDGVDINCGCPVKKVVKKGAGSALLKDPDLIRRILIEVKSAVDIPVSLKIRSGWDKNSIVAPKLIDICNQEEAAWVSLHARTKTMIYSGFADWKLITTVAKNSDIPIIGNGDIDSPKIAVQRLKESGCRAVMAGRAVMKNPWLLSDSFELWKNGQVNNQHQPLEFLDELSRELEKLYDGRQKTIALRKFAAWFSAGIRGAAEFRSEVNCCHDWDELNVLINRFYAKQPS